MLATVPKYSDLQSECGAEYCLKDIFSSSTVNMKCSQDQLMMRLDRHRVSSVLLVNMLAWLMTGCSGMRRMALDLDWEVQVDQGLLAEWEGGKEVQAVVMEVEAGMGSTLFLCCT